MLIVALVLAVVGLAALVTAVITSNEVIAWVCIVASVIGVLLLIIDALRSRSKHDEDADQPDEAVAPEVIYDEEYPEEAPVAAEYDDAPAAETADDAEPATYYSEEATEFAAEENPRQESADNDPAKS